MNIEKLVAGIHDYLSRAFAPFNARLAEHERRLEEMEQNVKDFTYLGVWESGTPYARNNSVTYNGSVWICRAPRTTQRPGDTGDWQLAVRHGRDART